MDPYRKSPSLPAAKAAKAAHSDCGLLSMLMVVGLLPFVGLAVRGQWSESELGLATLLVLFAGRQLAREAGHRLRARHARRERTQETRADD